MWEFHGVSGLNYFYISKYEGQPFFLVPKVLDTLPCKEKRLVDYQDEDSHHF